MILLGFLLLSIGAAVVGTIVFEWFLCALDVVCCEIKEHKYWKMRG